MVISNSKVVSVSYELRLNEADGEVIEQVGKENPLSFISGTGNMLPKFEEYLSGQKVGDKFKFKLTNEEAYGPIDQEAIVELPKDIFLVDGKVNEDVLSIGNRVPMRDSYGNQYTGIVLEIGDNHVKMDFNHPLAGEVLHFSGEVLEVRDATEEELAHGHLHGESHGCGCGEGGGCGDGEGSCCGSDEGCDCSSDKDESQGCGCTTKSCDC